MRFLISVPIVLTPAQTFGFTEAPPPAWASAGLLLIAMLALCLALRRTSETAETAQRFAAEAWPFARRPRPALLRSGEAARRRLGLADAQFR